MVIRWAVLLLVVFLGHAGHAAAPLCSNIFLAAASSKSASAEFADILPEALTFLRPSTRGNFEATLGSEQVFIKKLRGDSVQEAAWLQYLNSHGLGVKLHGILHSDLGKGDSLYMVIESAPGINTQFAMLAPDSFRLTKPVVSEIRRQAKMLADLGIIPVDLQFQVSADGTSVKIIDPELFQHALNPKSGSAETENILANIFLSWSMESKIEL